MFDAPGRIGSSAVPPTVLKQRQTGNPESNAGFLRDQSAETMGICRLLSHESHSRTRANEKHTCSGH